MSGSSDRVGASARLARFDTAEVLYGAVVSGAALAATSAHADSSTKVGIWTAWVLFVYWLAHLYMHVLAQQFDGRDGRALHRRLSAAFAETGVLIGGVPTVGAYVLATALGAQTSTAAYFALCLLAVLLFVGGYIGATHAGLRGPAALLEACGAGLFGVLLVVFKAALH